MRLLVVPGTISLFRPVCPVSPSEDLLGDGRDSPGSACRRDACADVTPSSYSKDCWRGCGRRA